MATISTFEDIQAWQKARAVTNTIYDISQSGEFRTDFELQKQIKRASVSMMANIAEGQGRRTKKEFANHLNIARGSCHEVQSLLYVALDRRYIEKEQFNAIYNDLARVSKMTLSFARYLRRN